MNKLLPNDDSKRMPNLIIYTFFCDLFPSTSTVLYRYPLFILDFYIPYK